MYVRGRVQSHYTQLLTLSLWN